MNSIDPFDSLLQQAREHRAPAHLWPAIALRVRGQRRQRLIQNAAAVLVGAVGFLLVAAAAGRSEEVPDARSPDVAAIMATSLPYLAGGAALAMPAEQLLLRQLATTQSRTHR
jgi:hypothetical protein